MSEHSNLESLPKPPAGKTGWPWTEESLKLPEKMPNGHHWPKISIVTPSFNQGSFIEATIRSVLLQDYPNLEYIIIDGGSTDETKEIIKKYEPWLKYWVSEKDDGQTYAIQKGMKRTSGELVNWLNSDDYLYPNALGYIAEFWRRIQDPECILCGAGRFVNSVGELVVESPIQEARESILPMSPPYEGGVQASWFHTKKAWEKIGGVDVTLDYTMDTDLYFRAHEAGTKFYPIFETIAAYRKHEETKTLQGWEKSISFKKRFYKRWLKKVNPKEKSLYKKRIKHFFANLYLRSIAPQDSTFTRLKKVRLAVTQRSELLFNLYHLKRLISLLRTGDGSEVTRPD